MDGSGQWVALFSGGKDSNWALYQAIEAGLEVTHLLTAEPCGDAYLFHVPAIQLTPLAAESIGLPIQTFPVDPPESEDATVAGEEELAALRAALGELEDGMSGTLEGIISGAVASRFQYDRVERICTEFDVEQYAPLWGCDPESTLRAMIDAGFEIHIVAVAAGGLDRSWLGRRLGVNAIEELLELHETYGIHLLGEGGEYETVVVDGPHMGTRLKYEACSRWDGTRGYLEITDAWLER